MDMKAFGSFRRGFYKKLANLSLALIVMILFSPFHLSSEELKTLVRRYVELSPVVASKGAQERSKSLDFKLADLQWLPSLSLSAQMIKSYSPLATSGIPNMEGFSNRDFYRTTLDLEQPIYLGGRVSWGRDLKKLTYWLSKWEHLASRQGAIADFLTTVIHFLSIDEQIILIKKSEKTQKRVLDLTRKNYKKGVAQAYELRQAEAEALSFVPRIDQLRQERQMLLNRLRTQLDMKEKDIRIQWPQKKLKDFPSQLSEEILDLAKSKNPDYQRSVLQVKLVQVQNKFDLGSYNPTVTLTGSWGFANKAVDRLVDDLSEDRSLVLSVNIPLFSRFSSFYTRRMGQEQISASKKMRYEAERRLKIQLEKSILDYNSSLRRLKQARNWSAKALQALNLAEKSYRVGRVGSLQIHQLQKASEVAALSMVQAKGGSRLAELNYRLTMGEGEEYMGD